MWVDVDNGGWGVITRIGFKGKVDSLNLFGVFFFFFLGFEAQEGVTNGGWEKVQVLEKL